MAKSSTHRVTIYINGKEVEASVIFCSRGMSAAPPVTKRLVISSGMTLKK